MKFLIIFLLLSFGSSASAADYKVLKINEDRTRAILDNPFREARQGDVMTFSDEFAEVCEAPVLKIENDTLVADISSCKTMKAILVGTNFQRKPAATPPKNTSAENHHSEDGPTISEDWYFMFSLGTASIYYSDKDDRDLVDALEAIPGIERGSYSYDVLGFYWPHKDDPTQMSGFVLGMILDSFSDSDEKLMAAQYLYSYSFMDFAGKNIGDGWFFRGDAGLAKVSMIYESPTLDFNESSDMGLGLTVGGGYGFGLGRETRMLVGLYYSYITPDDAKAGTTRFNLSFLF